MQNDATERRTRGWLVGSCVALIVLCGLGLTITISSLVGFFTNLVPEESTELEEVVVQSAATTRKIVRIDIHGLIMREGSIDDGVASVEAVMAALDQAEKDDDVVAVILDIDSPGGAVVASSQLYEAIRAFSKPKIAVFSGEVAASGAVYAAMGADTIYSHPATLTGSIGVIAEFLDLSKLMADYGVTQNTIKSGAYKDMGSLTREMTTEERALLQDVIDQSYADFVRVITENRGLTETQVQAFADGRVFTGQTAVEYRLIDGIGDFDDAYAAAITAAGVDGARVVRYEYPFGFPSLLSLLSLKFGQANPLSALTDLQQNPSLRLSYVME